MTKKSHSWQEKICNDLFGLHCLISLKQGCVDFLYPLLIRSERELGALPCTACCLATIRHGRERRAPKGTGRTPPPGRRRPNSPQKRYLPEKDFLGFFCCCFETTEPTPLRPSPAAISDALHVRRARVQRERASKKKKGSWPLRRRRRFYREMAHLLRECERTPGRVVRVV